MRRRICFTVLAVAALVLQPGVASAAAPPGPPPGTIVVAGDSLDNQYSAVVAYPPHAKPAEIGYGLNLLCAAVDGHGNIYYCDDGDIVELPANGGPATTRGVGDFPIDLAVDDAGDVFVSVSDIGAEYFQVTEFPGDGSAPRPFGDFDHPTELATDRAGNLYVTDAAGLWRIHADGTGKKMLGGRKFVGSSGIAVDADGVIYAADAAAGLVRVLARNGRTIRTITGLDSPGSPAIEPNGAVLVTVAGPSRIIRMAPDGSRRRTVIDHQFGDVAVYVPTGRD